MTITESKRFYVELLNGDKIPVAFTKNTVVITTIYGDKVTFSKTNRGRMIRDSRQKKPITANEAKDEIERMLGLNWHAVYAFESLMEMPQ